MPKVYISPQRVATVIGETRAAYNAFYEDGSMAAWCRHGVKVAQSEVNPSWEVTGEEANKVLGYRDSLGKRWFNCTT